MIPVEHPYFHDPELILKIPQRIHAVEQEIHKYRAEDGNYISDIFDNVNERITYAEDPSWQRRRDAYDTAVLVHHGYKGLSQLQENQRKLGVSIGFDSLQHHFTPITIISLIRQQIFNWQAMGEVESSISIYDLKAALERRFYQAYKGSQRKNGYLVRDVVDLYHLVEITDEAIKIDPTFIFQPTQWEDVGNFGSFMQSITKVPPEENKPYKSSDIVNQCHQQRDVTSTVI